MSLELPTPGWGDDDEAGPTPGGLLDGLPSPELSGSLSLLMDPKDIEDIGAPATASDRAGGRTDQPALQQVRAPGGYPHFTYEQTRPELERMTKDPAIAKAIDDDYARSHYARPNDYKGEPGFYLMEDSSGGLSVQPYGIKKSWVDRDGPHTIPDDPDGFADFIRNRKPVAIFHPHPNGGSDWVGGPSPRDVDFAHDHQIPGIIKAPDGLHFYGVPTPSKPAPYHGLFDW